MIKGIFFDVGGTLYSYRTMQPAMKVLLDRLGERIEHDPAELLQNFVLANKEEDQNFATRPFYLFRDYFRATFENMLRRVDKPHLNHHFDWYEQNQIELLVNGLQLQEDCHETLGKLKDMGLYLSAVSNADDNHLEILIDNGQLHRWLTHWTSSETAQSCKPDPRFFELALDKSGLTPDQVMFVGDSLEQDILGAHNAGMITTLISEVDGPAPMHIGREAPEPNYRINNLGELPGIIARHGA